MRTLPNKEQRKREHLALAEMVHGELGLKLLRRQAQRRGDSAGDASMRKELDAHLVRRSRLHGTPSES